MTIDDFFEDHPSIAFCIAMILSVIFLLYVAGKKIQAKIMGDDE